MCNASQFAGLALSKSGSRFLNHPTEFIGFKIQGNLLAQHLFSNSWNHSLRLENSGATAFSFANAIKTA